METIKNKRKKLIVSIVTFNSLEYIGDCLDSVLDNKPSCSCHVVVVDNDSQDGTAEFIEKNYPQVTLIKNRQNMGFAAANNLAARNTDSQYILLINSDCKVFEHSIQKLVDFMDKNKGAAVAGPKIINSDGSIQHSCRKFPSMLNATVHTLLTVVYPENPFSRKYKLADIDKSKPFEVDWVSGSCMMVRRKAIEGAGMLDEKYFMYVEDLDICFRMWKQGWKVYYFPYAKVLHHVGGSSGGKDIRASYRMQKSVFRFFWKNHRRNWRVVFIPILVMVLSFRVMLTACKKVFG
ncbi:MAG: glycosyltransferase family 2 protein [Candidatus Humimicrobiaceae bacterium]